MPITKNKIAKIKKFFTQFPTKKLVKGEFLIKPGDKFENVYFNKSGFGRIYTKTNKGENVINLFRPAFMFSVIHFLTEQRNDFFIQAISPAQVYVAPYSEFKKFIKEDPEIYSYIMDYFFGSLLNYFVNQGNISNGTAQNKIASVMLQLTQDYSDVKNGKLVVNFPATHRIIATLVGLTRETTSVQMSKLQKLGIVSTTRNQFIVNDLKKLKKLAQVSE